MRVVTAISLCTVVLTTACSSGDNSVTDSAGGAADTSAASASAAGGNNGQMTDANIFATLTAVNAAEVSASTLARDSASNAEVKAYARTMVTEHNAMNESVHHVAQQLNIVSQTGDRTEDVAELGKDISDDLRGKKGPDFDRAYMDGMVKSHEDALAFLDRAGQATNTPQLDQAITEARPKVQAHLDQAKQIQGKIKQ